MYTNQLVCVLFVLVGADVCVGPEGIVKPTLDSGPWYFKDLINKSRPYKQRPASSSFDMHSKAGPGVCPVPVGNFWVGLLNLIYADNSMSPLRV